MKPITFQCDATLKQSPDDIAAQILDLNRWPEFQGYAFLPGIKVAEFELRTLEIVGSKIRVQNTDGSSHVEEIVQWNLPQCLQMQLKEFSPPLNRLASYFEETWEFAPRGDATKVVRSFAMHAKSRPALAALWIISFFLKAAVRRHLRQMSAK